jgi:quercetin dioxygenase-like cupin family protein
MATTVIRGAEARRTETPNAVMTTFASPTQGGSTALSMWQVEMQAGQQGPPHVFATEQVWTVVEGAMEVAVGDEHLDLQAGDSVVLPAGVLRHLTATAPARLVVCSRADAVVSVPGENASRGVPPWIA